MTITKLLAGTATIAASLGISVPHLPVSLPHLPSISTSASAPATSTTAQMHRGMSASMTAPWALSQLSHLSVKPAGSMNGYSRSLYPTWRDASTWGWPVAPSNACTSREAALYRDGNNVKVNPTTCAATSGTWLDPYSGTTITSASKLDTDHVVAEGNGHISGMATRSLTERTAYANDPLNLVSAGASANRSKGDASFDRWKPSKANAANAKVVNGTSTDCVYATRIVAVKSKYHMNVTVAERTALTNTLRGCSK